VGDTPYHHWRARWRAWRRATKPGPRARFDLADRIRMADDELLAEWSADLAPTDRRWLNKRGKRAWQSC